MFHRNALFIALFCATGCGASSNYARVTTAPGEITWSYSGGLSAMRDGGEVAGVGTWSGLSDAVGCVEEARQFADGVSSQKVAGQITFWTGILAIPAGGAAGGVMMVEADGSKDLLKGAAVFTGGVLGGLVISLIGSALETNATVDAIDAVNAYNDQRTATPACSPAN